MSDGGNLENSGHIVEGKPEEEGTTQSGGLQEGIRVVAQEVGEVAGEVVVGIVGGIIGSILDD